MEKAFTENEGLVKKVASKFAFRYNVDFEDAYAEACLAFVKYYPNFDETHSRFSTYMWTCIFGQLQNWHRNTVQKHQALRFVGKPGVYAVAQEDEELEVMDTKPEFSIEGLSEIAQYAVDMLTGELTDLVDSVSDKPNKIRDAIQSTLIALGYRRVDVLKAFDEIRAVLV